MKTITHEASITWFSSALSIHARQVRQYCQSSLSRISSLPAEKKQLALEEFLSGSQSLLGSLKQSIKASAWLQQAGALNVERLEAEVELIEGLIKKAEGSAGSLFHRPELSSGGEVRNPRPKREAEILGNRAEA